MTETTKQTAERRAKAFAGATGGFDSVGDMEVAEVIAESDKEKGMHYGFADDEGTLTFDISHMSTVAISALIPEGYALVPVEPTEKMIEAGDCARFQAICASSNAYRAMIAAAQEKE